MGPLLQQKCTDRPYPSQYDNKLAVNTVNNYKIRCQSFEGEPEIILEAVIMEYKRQKWASIIFVIFERLRLFSIEGCTIWICKVLLIKPLSDWNQASILIADIWNYHACIISLVFYCIDC